MFGLEGYTLLHIAISLLAIASGFVVVGGFLADARLTLANHLFLATNVATNVTGLLFPFQQLLPSHIVAIIALAVLAVAIYAFYFAKLANAWRSIYVLSATAALYLNVFVLVAQTFAKNPALVALAPTQSEFPFALTQLLTLGAFLVLGYFAWARFSRTPS